MTRWAMRDDDERPAGAAPSRCGDTRPRRACAQWGAGIGGRLSRLAALPLVSGLLLGAAAPADDLRVRLRQGAPIVCAHRGWLGPDRAENSLRTMRDTEARGRFMLEMDLAVSRDGAIVLMHDPTVDRTTTGTGPVAALDRTALARLALRPRGAAPTGEAPPLLSDVLGWAAATPGTLLMLDLKHTPPAMAMGLVRRAGMQTHVLLLCFDNATAAAAFASDPDVAVSVLVKTDADLAQARQLAGGHFFLAYVPLDRPPELFAHAHALGIPVVTDLLDPHNAFTERFGVEALRDRPVAIVVGNHPVRIEAALRGDAGRKAKGAAL